VLAVGLLGSLVTAVSLVRPTVLGIALCVSAGAYALLLALDDPPLDARAAVVAVVLLVVGELVGWARELGGTTVDEPGGAWRRPIWIATVSLVALALAWGLLALVDLARVEGLAVEVVGALAAVAALLLIRRVAYRQSSAPRSTGF
jgi:hypothetical protein